MTPTPWFGYTTFSPSLNSISMCGIPLPEEHLQILGRCERHVKVFSSKFNTLRGRRNACFSSDWPRNCHIIASMLILALDTSSPAGSLAILRDEKVTGVISTWAEETYSARM